MRVLVVEDDALTVGLLEELLGGEGYTVDHAGNGLGALVRVAVCRPDVIVLDYLMPAMDGLEFLRKLRQDERFRTLPVILTTAAAEEDLQRLLASTQGLPPLWVLRKPFDLEELRQLIDHVGR